MNALVLALMTWTAAFMGVPVPDKAPEVTLASPRDLHILATGSDAGYDPEDDIGFKALYDDQLKQVYVSDQYDPANIYWTAALVHELAHYLQDINGITAKAPCPRAIETQAYAAQDAFLQGAGRSIYPEDESPEKPFKLNRLAVALFSMCRESWGGPG